VSAPSILDRFRGCLLGGAIGDALGAPVEFLSLDEIRRRFGEAGITDFDTAYGRRGAITDDTQMTLFTAEGLIRAHQRFSDRGICNVPALIERGLPALALNARREGGSRVVLPRAWAGRMARLAARASLLPSAWEHVSVRSPCGALR
jgi:hypothetical protein